jgi:hypothetical protein
MQVMCTYKHIKKYLFSILCASKSAAAKHNIDEGAFDSMVSAHQNGDTSPAKKIFITGQNEENLNRYARARRGSIELFQAINWTHI